MYIDPSDAALLTIAATLTGHLAHRIGKRQGFTQGLDLGMDQSGAPRGPAVLNEDIATMCKNLCKRCRGRGLIAGRLCPKAVERFHRRHGKALVVYKGRLHFAGETPR